MGRKKMPPGKTFESYYGVRLNYADQQMLESLFRRFAIGGETKSDKLRLLIRAIYTQHV